MTKKHFIALADAIRDHNDKGFGPEFSAGQLNTLLRFCESQNPRFNADRWLGYIAGTNAKNGGKVKASQSTLTIHT